MRLKHTSLEGVLRFQRKSLRAVNTNFSSPSLLA
jgi:hypothetical protein